MTAMSVAIALLSLTAGAGLYLALSRTRRGLEERELRPVKFYDAFSHKSVEAAAHHDERR
jgi:hypothetical protein